MKKIFTLFILIFFFNLHVQAENIEDFEIEGISLGDSALEFFTEAQIKKNTWNYYKSKTYVPVQNDQMSFFETYYAVDFHFKRNDDEYKIVDLSGIIDYRNKDMNECYKEMDEIALKFDSLFTNIKRKYPKKTYKHPNKKKNKSGKSTFTEIRYVLKNGDNALIACYDYSVEHGSMDHLNITINKKKFGKWLQNKAY